MTCCLGNGAGSGQAGRLLSEAHIESLADSIERFGLIHNLAGLLDEDGKVGIVAGGCRLRAIQVIAERSKTHPFTTVRRVLGDGRTASVGS